MLWAAIAYLLIVSCAVRVLLRPYRDPASRIAWLAIIFALPGLGILAYLLLGETNVGAKRTERIRRITQGLPRPEALTGWPDADAGQAAAQLFKVGESITGYHAAAGNSAELMADSAATIQRMLEDIDCASEHVHIMFYIWLNDTSGQQMAEAAMRAAARGVTVRAMVDDLGSRDMLRSDTWAAMGEAGVQLGRALPIGNPLLRALGGRIDLRNHRKILVIDNKITYCGSQNCADAAFSPKPKYAPWVDAVMRFTGPVVRQNQHLFATDWMASVDEDISELLEATLAPASDGFPAQVIGTGPTVRYAAMTHLFASCIYAATSRLVITTPYYVPVAMIQAAITGAARRGVETTLILPKRNDDFAVGATSRSYYQDLLEAGVRLYEYRPGLLHTKSITIDGRITLIGSANMDRRSFELNYENNILLEDVTLTRDMLERQMSYQADSHEVTLAEVQAWPRHQRLWQNTLAIISPIL
ncbi:MAG: cardiolipin synthase [Pseudomonadota bacterium]